MSKAISVAEAGRLGGLRGGTSTSAAKVRAARKNIAKATRARMAKRKAEGRAKA